MQTVPGLSPGSLLIPLCPMPLGTGGQAVWMRAGHVAACQPQVRQRSDQRASFRKPARGGQNLRPQPDDPAHFLHTPAQIDVLENGEFAKAAQRFKGGPSNENALVAEMPAKPSAPPISHRTRELEKRRGINIAAAETASNDPFVLQHGLNGAQSFGRDQRIRVKKKQDVTLRVRGAEVHLFGAMPLGTLQNPAFGGFGDTDRSIAAAPIDNDDLVGHNVGTDAPQRPG